MKPSFLFAFLTFAAWPGSLSGQIPVRFLEPRTFGSGWGQSIVVADFNADGALDVAMVGTDVEVYLGNGHGSFTGETPIGFSGTAIVAGDLNGDGIPDLAIASSTDLIVLPGKGNGTFGPPLAYPGNFTVLTLGDFNGDGILDVAAGTTAGQVQIFFGSAGGSLRPGPLTTLPVGRPLAIVAADFNLDNKVDLAVTGLTGATPGIAILFGNGDGTFAAPVTYPIPSRSSLVGLVSADFNRDGAPDLAYAVDINGAYSMEILLNHGSGNFSAGAPIGIDVTVTALAAADLNGDGIPDLVVAGGGLGVILLGKGQGEFQQSGQYVLAAANALAIADFNGDGIPDVVSANATEYNGQPPLSLMLGVGKGAFHSSRAYAISPQPEGIAAGDFNQDGNLDLVVANDRDTAPTIAVLLGDGKGGFRSPANYPANQPGLLAASDVNRDGKLDVVFIGYNSVGTLPGKGDGTFGPAIYSPCLSCGYVLAVTDFNGDGKPDIVTSQLVNGETYTIVLLLGNGDGTFLPPVVIGDIGEPGHIAFADFNNDGDLDLAIDGYSGATYILLNNGDGTFGAPILLHSIQGLAGVGDFNGDGNVDIALSEGAIYLGNGNGTFTPAFQIATPGAGAVVGDFNGDGILDMINVSSYASDEMGTVLLGQGNGNFVEQQPALQISSQPPLAVAGDFNGDGKLDLATVSYLSPVWVLLNTTVH